MNDLMESSGAEIKAAFFLQVIKRSTAGLHQILESNRLLSAIISPEVTMRHYRCYLILMKKIEEAYEENILPELTAVTGAMGQQKASALIEADLQCIGHLPLSAPFIKNYILPVESNSMPFALGFMYVMEGSKLGGKVIFKHLNRYLGLSENNGAKFISNYGTDTIARWKQFLSCFSEYVTANGCDTESIRGAEYAFASIYDFFESNRLVYES